MCFHRYTGRGLFLDPPTVYMCNGVWKLSLPEALHLEIPKLENKGKPYIFFKSTIILNCHLDLILCLFENFSTFLYFTAFSSRDEIFHKIRDKSDLARNYSSYISEQLLQYSGSGGFYHIGALIMEPGKISLLLFCFNPLLNFHIIFLFIWKLKLNFSWTLFYCLKLDAAVLLSLKHEKGYNGYNVWLWVHLLHQNYLCWMWCIEILVLAVLHICWFSLYLQFVGSLSRSQFDMLTDILTVLYIYMFWLLKSKCK